MILATAVQLLIVEQEGDMDKGTVILATAVQLLMMVEQEVGMARGTVILATEVQLLILVPGGYHTSTRQRH